MPADGVYVVDIEVQRKDIVEWREVGKMLLLMEKSHALKSIFWFSDDIYGETVIIYWLDRVREMVKFPPVEELVDQLQKDEEIARIEGCWVGCLKKWTIFLCLLFYFEEIL